jgi:hypothetical protein
MKKDIAVTISAADRLLETLTDPLHRQIIENYRRHAILEVCGEWEGIFAPEMTVAVPEYYYNITGYEGIRAVGDDVKAVYKHLADTSTAVIVVEDERLMVSDWGFCSDAMFNTYQRGRDLVALGVPEAGDLDPEGPYVLRQHFAMIWPYDDHGRMVGEHVYENKARREIVPIAEEDHLTMDDARARLLPMLRPLPHYEPAMRHAGRAEGIAGEGPHRTRALTGAVTRGRTPRA